MNHLILLAAAFFGVRPVPQDNMLVIVVDQLSEWATDPAERAPLDLPNLDALAAQGRTFSRCYTTSPVCSENRLALLTGQYPFSLGTSKLEPGVPTMGTIFDAAGYDTGYVGKWHLSPDPTKSGRVKPEDRVGWRFFAGNEGAPHEYENNVSWVGDDTTAISTSPWEPAWNTQQALRFLRTDRNKPFLLVVNYSPPHPQADSGYAPPSLNYDPAEITPRPNTTHPNAPQRIAKYMSLCDTVDVELGDLLAEVDLATTLVVFTADHGDLLYAHGAGHSDQKRWPFEECAHVPLVIAGPGMAAGEESSLVSTVDILPSLLFLASLAGPPEIQGSEFPSATAIYFGHDSANKSWGGERWRGLVDGDWKYAVTESGALEGLWDLSGDPYELVNLAPNPLYAPTLNAMRAAAVARAASIEDPFFDE